MQEPEPSTVDAVPVVSAGEVIVTRLFDIAYAIDLARAERLWSEHLGSKGSRVRLTAPEKALAFGVPPLSLELESVDVKIDDASCTVHARARVYDFGVVALALRLPVADMPWNAFVARFGAIDRVLGGESAHPVWDTLLEKLRRIVGPALDRPAERIVQEDYLLALVRSLQPPLDASALRERVDLAELLSGETRPLSAGARRELLHRAFSYFADDLVVLTWDRAFVLEPRDDTDVIDVIEVANAQVVEFRYYDELLDLELPRMYDRIELAQSAVSLLAAHRFANLARGLYKLVAEVTELRERVDNALQVTEDVYLARVYAAALDLFRVPTVNATVDRKLAIIRETYTALYDEASSRRAELLEMAIIVLILVEIGLALWKR